MVLFHFVLVFLWLRIKGKDELDLTVKTDRDEKGRHHLAGGVEGGRPSSIPPPQKTHVGVGRASVFSLPSPTAPNKSLQPQGLLPAAAWAVYAAVSSSPKARGCGTLFDRIPPPLEDVKGMGRLNS